MKPQLWKTGAAAVVLTIVFAVLVAAFGKWTDETFTVTWIIPQIPVGSADGNRTTYRTIMQIVNTGSTAIKIKGNFYKPADGSASDTLYTTNLPNASTIDDGALGETTVPANGIVVLTAAAPVPSTYKNSWGKIQATGNIGIATFFEIRSVADNALSSRLSVAASHSMSKFVIQRIRDVEAGMDVAFAVANAGSTPALITATLRDAGGGVVAARTLNIAAGAQIAQFVGELFGQISDPPGVTHSFVTFDGGPSAQLGAIAICYEGATQTSVPVTQIQ